MKVIDNILYKTVADLVACGFKEGKINDYSSTRKYSTLSYIKIKGSKFFPWETLGEKYKERILKTFGEPLEYLQKAPIKALVKKDLNAERFF